MFIRGGGVKSLVETKLLKMNKLYYTLQAASLGRPWGVSRWGWSRVFQ